MASVEQFMAHHQRNLKKQLGKNGNWTTKYEYIVSRDELIESYIHRMDDLGYPLRVEPKRDRYVVNKQALEKALIEASTQALNQIQEDIIHWVEQDVSQMIEESAYDIYNSITELGSYNVNHKNTNNKKHWATKLGERFGKALGQSISKIIDDTFSGTRR